MSRIFLVEDDLQLAGTLRQILQQSSFDSHWQRRATDAPDALRRGSYAAAIVDVQLPDGDGFELVDRLRRHGDWTPVLVLTVRNSVGDRVRGLDLGADDCLSKPFAAVELISRVRALIRRNARHCPDAWRVGPLQLDPRRHSVTLDDQSLELSPREYRLLVELARRAGQVVPRVRLEALVFRVPEGGGSNRLDVHIFNLRRKLRKDLIRTVRGVGYMLDA